MVNRSKAANLSGAQEALEKYFVMFYGNPDNLTVMGQELASISDHVLLAECVAESDRLGYPGIDLRELLVELLTKRSDWKKVSELLGEIATRKVRFNIPTDGWQIFYESLCAAALDPDPARQKAFLSILREEQTTATPLAYETFIKLLGLEDRVETAQNIALLARQRFPETRDWLALARQFEMRRAATNPQAAP